MSQDISRDSYSVRVFSHDLASALQKFHDTVWPARHGSKGTLRTSSIDHEDTVENREPSTPIFLFLKNKEVIGHLGTMSVEIQHGDVRFPAHWVVGLMVLPEFRNGLVGPQLIKKVSESLSFAMTLHVEDAVSRIVKGSQMDSFRYHSSIYTCLEWSALGGPVAVGTHRFPVKPSRGGDESGTLRR